jgi:uncharacterized protein YecT (DUF1311 family)
MDPLDQTSMNIAAAQDLKGSEDELAKLFSLIRSRVDKRGKTTFHAGNQSVFQRSASEWTTILEESQEKWLAYRNSFTDFATFLSLQGTAHPTLWSAQARAMTDSRAAELRSWLEADKLMSGDD